MAYFDCIVGGSGKGNTLVVTCADDLAGATITCTNGTKTYTKTCPSTAPYEVTFYGLAAGTWTVSATVSGNTYTTTVVITDYEAELGGFSWRAWVDLSKNYTSSDFTDLDDLLSDETAVRELMTIHDCVDYLAGIAAESPDVETIIGNDLCAKWINNRDYALDTLYANEIIADYMDTADKYFYGEWVITDDTTTPPTWGAKGNVPIMTANNAPYGEAIGANAQTANPYYYAFDGSDSTAGATTSGGNIGYKFVNPVCVKRVLIWNHNSDRTYLLEASNDNSTYTPLETISMGNGERKTVDIDNDNYYLYYRIRCANDSVGLTNLQFYGRELWKQENSQYVPDYSEKEFEEGTTKKWLYDHGVELETINVVGTVTKGTDAIQLTAANAQASATIDTTDYSVMRGKVGSHASGTNQLLCGSGSSNFTANNMPYNNGFDVSSVNGSNAVGVKQTANGIFDATELWLE